MNEQVYRDLDKTHVFSTMLKTLYSQSAKHLDIRKDSSSFNFGRLSHMNVLEPERFEEETIEQPVFAPLSKEMKLKYAVTMVNGIVSEVHTDYGRTKECREQKELFEKESDGLLVVSKSDAERLKEMKAVLISENKPFYKSYIVDGESEATIVRNNFQCGDMSAPAKVRLDKLIIDDTFKLITIVDYKTTQNASPHAFKYEVKKYGYEIQAAFYIDIVMDNPLYKDYKIDFIWLAQESLPPYNFGYYRCSEDTYLDGKHKYQSVFKTAVDILNGAKKEGYKASKEIVSI